MLAAPLTNVEVPVRVQSAIAMRMGVRVGVEAARKRQPAAQQSEHDQEAAARKLAALLEAGGNLPAEEQHERRANRQQQRVTDGKFDGQPERAAVLGWTERRGEGQSGDGHQVIGTEAVKKSEREHRSAQHA